jgi:hypothetical protein
VEKQNRKGRWHPPKEGIPIQMHELVAEARTQEVSDLSIVTVVYICWGGGPLSKDGDVARYGE